MPVIRAADAAVHHMHGSVFTSYAASATGSRELCAWRLEVPAGTSGVPHRVSREEVVFLLSGALRVTLSDAAVPATADATDADATDGDVTDAGATDAAAGDVIVVPAGAVFRIDNPGPEQALAWVTTSVGLEALLPDGSTFRPPWAS